MVSVGEGRGERLEAPVSVVAAGVAVDALLQKKY